MEHIVIIGNGIAGLRLHVIFEKIRFKITIVSSETEFSFLVPL
jgi:aspartate oxidase